MIRLLFRLVILVVVVAAVAVFAFGYWWSAPDTTTPAGTAERGPLDPDRARQAGAQIAETVAEGASRAGQALDEGRLTAKIRAKMQLDDTIDVSDVNVDTDGTVVTLRGEAATRQQHQRILQLARETAGVTAVVDQLTVRER
jgi:hyperosmotically inducible protein